MTDLDYGKLNAFSQRNFGVDYNAGMQLAAGINKDLNGISQQLYGVDANGAADQLYSLIGARGINISSTAASSWLDTPDHADLDILGDIDFRVELEWHGGNGQNQAIVSKHGGAANTSFEYRVALTGVHQFFWSADGTALPGVVDMTAPPGFGNRIMLRFTMDVDNGSAQRVITYYYSLGNDISNGPWTQVDQDVIAGTTSIFNSTAVLRLGNRSTGGASYNGRIFRAQLRNGIGGTIAANPDMRFLAPGTTSFVDSTGKTWTLGAGATVS